MALPPMPMMMNAYTWFNASSPPHPEMAERRSSQPQVLAATLPSFAPATPDLLSSAFDAADWTDFYSHAPPPDINPPPPLANPSPSSLPYATSTMAIISLNRPLPSPPVLPAPPPAHVQEDAHSGVEDTQTPSSTSSSGRIREKRHACWMCHKSFDRPSTLRKVCSLSLQST